MKTTIMRPFNMFGPDNQRIFIIPSIIARHLKKRWWNLEPYSTAICYISQMRSKECSKIAEQGEGVYNIGSGIETSIKEVVETIIKIIESWRKKYVS